MDGLIHVSELSWKHVDHPGSVVAVGDEVTVQVLDVDLDRERISLSLKATQQDPWQEFASTHRVGELVYGRVTKLVPFGAFVQVGEGIEGLVHISEMSARHVDLPEQVVTPGEELWVKIIDLDLARRRISLSIKQAAEGGEVAEEYREHFGEHAFDAEGNYIGAADDAEREAAWAEYYEQYGEDGAPEGASRRRRRAAEAEAAACRGATRRRRRRRGGRRGRSSQAPASRRSRLSERSERRRGRPDHVSLTIPIRTASEHGLGAVAGVQLLVDRRQVVLHRLLADVQLLRHLGRRAAVGDQLQHLFLALGDEAVLFARRPSRRSCAPR